MKDLSVIVPQARDYYITRFMSAREEALKFGDAELEIPLCDDNGNIKTEGRLETSVKIDIVIFSSDNPIRSMNVDTESMLNFGGVFVQCAGQAVQVYEFQWNCLRISMIAQSVSVVEGALLNWFNYWFDHEDDTLSPLFGCVHFISDPEWIGTKGATIIDMGTAPVSALTELITAIQSAGVKEPQRSLSL